MLEALSNQEYNANKVLPEAYKVEILYALSHYPELQNVQIYFELRYRGSVAYSTKPALRDVLSPKKKRRYVVSLLNNARKPMQDALFRNLNFPMRIAVIAHELAHVVQYEKCKGINLLIFLCLYLIPGYRRRIERAADMATINRGLGRELLEHATYIRTIPGYLELRPSIKTDCLSPAEIKNYL